MEVKKGQRWRYKDQSDFDFIVEVITRKKSIIVQNISKTKPQKIGEKYPGEIGEESYYSSWTWEYLIGQDKTNE